MSLCIVASCVCVCSSVRVCVRECLAVCVCASDLLTFFLSMGPLNVRLVLRFAFATYFCVWLLRLVATWRLGSRGGRKRRSAWWRVCKEVTSQLCVWRPFACSALSHFFFSIQFPRPSLLSSVSRFSLSSAVRFLFRFVFPLALVCCVRLVQRTALTESERPIDFPIRVRRFHWLSGTDPSIAVWRLAVFVP